MQFNLKRALCVPLLAGATSVFATTAFAAHLQTYTVDVNELNASGVSGTGILTLDTIANTLKADFSLIGLEPNVAHAMHLHGRFDANGAPMDSVTPTIVDDADGDGFVEVFEGLTQYGDIILPFISQSTDNGVVQFTDIFDLNDSNTLFSPVTSTSYDISDLLPLALREFVIHGMTVPSGIGAGTEGEVDGTGGYLGFLPVGAGEISPALSAAPVPLPAPLALLAAGTIPLISRVRRKTA